MWRSGKQHDNARFALNFGLQPLSWRSASGIRQYRRAVQDVGLPGLGLRHLQAALREALVHNGDDFVITFQFDS